MPPISKKRSRPDDDETAAPQRRRIAPPPAPQQQQHRQRLPVGQSSLGYRRQQQQQQQQPQQQSRGAGGGGGARIANVSEEEEDDAEEEDEEDDDGGDEGEGRDQGEITIERLAKKLVRLALASEFSRQAIRRMDISAKVLGPDHSGLFKPVFSAAQSTLRTVFGMHLVELPLRERITISQKRAAARSQGTATNTQRSSSSLSSKSYILLTTLPPPFRVPEILSFPPPTAANPNPNQKEPAFTALTTTICTLIYLNNRCLSEAKLDRYLKRLNIDLTTPIDKTEKILATMCKNGYLVKVKDSNSVAGDTRYEYHLGPRAKLEIGKEGVTSLVREIYGVTAHEDLSERVARNIGVDVEEERRAAGAREEGGRRTQGGTQRQQQGQRGSGGGRRRGEEEEDEDEEGDEDEEDEDSGDESD